MGKNRGLMAFARSFDTFGNSIQINYQGNESFQTLGGGLFSLVLRLGMTAFLVAKVVEVYNYEEPQITSYTIYESREKAQPIELSNSSFELYVGLLEPQSNSFIEIEPKYGSITMKTITSGVTLTSSGEL